MTPLVSQNIDKLRQEVETRLNLIAAPRAPSRVYACLEADLPPAASYQYCQALVTDLNCLAFSDGSDWIRADTGAAI